MFYSVSNLKTNTQTEWQREVLWWKHWSHATQWHNGGFCVGLNYYKLEKFPINVVDCLHQLETSFDCNRKTALISQSSFKYVQFILYVVLLCIFIIIVVLQIIYVFASFCSTVYNLDKEYQYSSTYGNYNFLSKFGIFS